MSPDVLTRLLRGEHLNMEERTKLGVWPHPPLKLDALVNHLSTLLQAEQWFPRPWEPHVPGQTVHEGGVIEREGPHRFVYRTQRHHPIQPTMLADRSERVFRSAESAARHYLHWDLNLPGDLDGWSVVE